MSQKNAAFGGKLQKHEKQRKKKKDNSKKDFDLNGKYSKKSIRKMEVIKENQKNKKSNFNKKLKYKSCV